MEVTFCDVLLSALPPNFLGIKDRNKQFMKCYICMSSMSTSLIISLSGIRLKQPVTGILGENSNIAKESVGNIPL